MRIATRANEPNAEKASVVKPYSVFTANGTRRLLQMQGNHGNQFMQRALKAALAKSPCSCGGKCKTCQARQNQGTLEVLQSAGRPLDATTRHKMERAFGTDFSAVRVHTGSTAAQSADAFGSTAYTAGTNIVFGHGHYQPATFAGKELLAHELAHVVQQGQNTTPAASYGAAEHEASHAAKLAIAGQPVKVRSSWSGGPQRQSKPDQSNRQSGGDTSNVGFRVDVLTEEEFAKRTGVDPKNLPENRLIQSVALGAFVPTQRAVTGSFTSPAVMPKNASGILWTNMQAGHLSIVGSAEGQLSPTYRGYRGTLADHLTASPEQIRSGIPGAFRNDLLYPQASLVPGGQTLVYRPRTPQEATAFLEMLNKESARINKQFPQYTFPPHPKSNYDPVRVCSATNCITVPRELVSEALGGPPTIKDPTIGEVDISVAGRREYTPQKSPFEPAQAGRGATMREYLDQSPDYFAGKGLTKVTPAALTATSYLRVGGRILLIYGIYKTAQRLDEAYGTPEFKQVATEETAAWVGGAIGSAVGSSAAAAIFCTVGGAATGGVVTLGCVAAGFVFGALGGFVGSEVGVGLVRPGTDKPETCPGGSYGCHTPNHGTRKAYDIRSQPPIASREDMLKYVLAPPSAKAETPLPTIPETKCPQGRCHDNVQHDMIPKWNPTEDDRRKMYEWLQKRHGR